MDFTKHSIQYYATCVHFRVSYCTNGLVLLKFDRMSFILLNKSVVSTRGNSLRNDRPHLAFGLMSKKIIKKTLGLDHCVQAHVCFMIHIRRRTVSYTITGE